jgi:hypothetical protein
MVRLTQTARNIIGEFFLPAGLSEKYPAAAAGLYDISK